MKRILLLLVLPLLNFAQTSPSTNKSFVKVAVPRIATINTADLEDYTKTTTTIQYKDGLGRPLQSIINRGSPGTIDLIAGTQVLDPLGREKRSYLPVQGISTNASYQTNGVSLAETFYNDTAPYTEIETYEASPMSRPLKVVGAGAAFRATATKKGVIEQIFTAGVGIRKYIISEDATGNITGVNGSTNFINGDLILNIITDESGNKTSTFIDSEGKTIESWQVTSGGSVLKTAYIYDDIGRLRYTIPPSAYPSAMLFNETNQPNTSFFSNAIYAVRYDERGRVSETHRPGAGWSYRVYNELDQVVMTQNARQRETNLWEWIRYDGHGRTVMAGTVINSASRSTLQQNFIDFLAPKQFEERNASGLYGYTSRSFPTAISISNTDVNRVYYYDDYDWVASAGSTTSQLNFVQYKTPRYANAKGLATGSIVRRLDIAPNVAGSWLKAVMYYDDKNRLIQSQTENRFGTATTPAINQTDIVLNFAGDLLEERTIYRKPISAGSATLKTLTVGTTYVYDHVGRKLGAVHSLNGKPTPLARYRYDAIGRLNQKGLMQFGQDYITENSSLPNGKQDFANRSITLTAGTITATNGTYLACVGGDMLQEIDYQYNIRGQLRGINTDASGNIALTNGDVFGLKLDYHETGQFFDGKLHKQFWTAKNPTSGISQTRGFTYAYDGFNRIQAATYTGVGSENYSLSNTTYDANGNIGILQRNGQTATNAWGAIDNLSYNYGTSSNRLNYITDAAQTTKGFKDASGTADYTYYNDGSLKSDLNRGITSILYNFLGLPERINFGVTKRIENVYDAEGLKLSQTLVNGTSSIRTDYMGDLIYRNDSLKSIMHDEGRVFYDAAQNPHYQFFIADHLGNTRIIIERVNASTALVQETHYGAWGEVLEGIGQAGNWNFLYQGKEFIDGVGYDFHSRSYDAWTGRFDQIDGADQFASGFVGMGNNPATMIDPDGQVADPISASVMAGAAITGGVVNLWANWSKIKGWKQGLAYFGSGAAGGLATLYSGGNFALGGAITAGGNAAIDIVSGKLPSLKRPQDIAMHVLDEVAMGAVLGEMGGTFGKFIGPKIGALYGWMQGAYINSQAFTEKIGEQLYTFAGSAGVKSSFGKLAGTVASSVAGATDDVGQKVGASLTDDAIQLSTSSKSILPSRTYTIYDGSGQLHKFGVTDANLTRYGQSLGEAGPGAYGKYSSIMPKNQAHIMEKYLRSLQYNSTGQYTLPGMKVPYPVNFITNLPIKR